MIVPQDISDGGVCGKSIYIDTEGKFRPERIDYILAGNFRLHHPYHPYDP